MIEPTPHVVRRGAGRPLLFLHGNGVDHRLLLDLDDIFEVHSPWERIYLDLPGFGRTAALDGPGGLSDLADWVHAAAGSLFGSAPFAIVANSLGGLLARDLASRRRGQCLGFALLAPVVDPARDQRTLPKPTVLVEDPELLASLDPQDSLAFAELAVVQSREQWERFRDAALPGIRAADARAMERLATRYALPALPEQRLDGFARPVLIVAGLQDAVVGFEDQRALARRFPGSTYAALERAGHNIHLDQPDAVRAMLREWLARLEPSREACTSAEH